MVNPGVVLMMFLAIGLTILVILILFIAASSNAAGDGTSVSLPSCSNNVDPSTLLQISPEWMYCTSNSKQGTLYYIGCTGNTPGDFVVGPVGQSPLNVCVSYCSTYTPSSGGFGTCEGQDFKGKSAQENFDQCMDQLNSDTCVPPKPLAADGTTLYYAYSATCNICEPGVCECYTSNQCQAQCQPSTN